MAKLIFIILVITDIIVVFVSRAVAYSLARPLEKITAVAQKVAEGDLAQEVEEIKTQDEIGRLSAAFRGMLEYIRELVTNIINTSSTLAASEDSPPLLRRFPKPLKKLPRLFPRLLKVLLNKV